MRAKLVSVALGMAMSMPAGAAIVTLQYNVQVGSFGTPDPDGAFHAIGTPGVVSVSFDNALTYIGAPDSYMHTSVSIPAGLKVTVGADVFTADNYYIDFYNAGPSRANPTVGFLTTDFSMLQPVLHNGLPFAGSLPGFMQFYFNGPSNNIALPIAAGLAFPLPTYSAEGLLRETFADDSHSYYFAPGFWSNVPAPGGATALCLGAALIVRRRR